MRFTSCLLAATLVALAHPMGSSSINRYVSLQPDSQGVAITYIVEFAESPAFDLLREWKLDPDSPRLQDRAAEQALSWTRAWTLTAAGSAVQPSIQDVSATTTPGSGGLPTLRVTLKARVPSQSRSLEFEDHNFQTNPGWREIVIRSAPGVSIVRASHSDRDRSGGLTAYPGVPPYDSRARLEWTTDVHAGTSVIEPISQPQPPSHADNPARTATPAGKPDYLSTLLGRRDLGLGVLLAGLAVAFGLGALHALSPGHGKTIVAAYLVGSHGTLRHAALLGATVTFTHTASVFLLGLGTLFLSQYVVPDRIYPILGVVSGLSIVAIGGSLLWKRARHALAHRYNHPHHHHHHHGPGGHHHHLEGDVSVGSLVALGASGGLVPCPSALVLLLSSVALGRIGLGLTLLVAFSLGLAVVLMAIGAAVLYARSWLPDSGKATSHPAFRYLPVLSAAVIVCLGMLMTAVSLGWVRPGGFAG